MPTVCTYILRRSRRRSVSLEVRPDGRVVVRAPLRLAQSVIDQVLQSRSTWLLQRIAAAGTTRAVVPPLPARGFYHRGVVMEWGVDGTIRRPLVRLVDADRPMTLLLPAKGASTDEDAIRQVEQWQRREAMTLFRAMIDHHVPALGTVGLRFRELRLRRMRRRWGSCSSHGDITLNDALVRTPDHCIRSVVVHELCHLAHMHHGPAFRTLMRDLMPDHEDADRLLDRWTVVLLPGTENGTPTGEGPVELRHVVLGG